MNKRDKVIKGLECCTTMDEQGWPSCEKCPYDVNGTCPDLDALHRDALMLLKAQEPRVMTLEDVNNIGPEDVCAFIEIREETHMHACYMHQYDETHTEIMCDVPDMPTKLQNGCVRLWTSRPTDKQRAETPWEGR